jgi:hypothetical protein
LDPRRTCFVDPLFHCLRCEEDCGESVATK